MDSGIRPADMPAMASGADGVVLSDVLMGLSEYELPENLRSRLAKATGENSHVVNGFRFQASALAPVLRRLLAAWFGSNQRVG